MARGFEGIRKAGEEIEARRQAGGGNWVEWFRLTNSGDSAVVRFLEQGDDVVWCWVHQMDPVGTQKFGENRPCLNQAGDGTPCPGCEQGKRRIVNGWINVIHRDAPVWDTEEVDNGRGGKWTKLKKDPQGNLIKVSEADQVKVWRGGIKVFEELDGIDATYKGLMSRDFRVTRKGTGLDTEYSIFPADPDGGPRPMSDADKNLASGKNDLQPFVTPPSYDDYMTGGQAAQPAEHSGGADGSNVNPFMAKRS